MSLDWGLALSRGVQSGANAFANQASAESEDERWIKRQKEIQAANREEAAERERFLLRMRPPESRKVNVTGADGKPAIRQEEWIPPTDGGEGTWRPVGNETPDINFERLEETGRHNKESEEAAVERLRLQGEANAAKAEAAATRAAGKKGGTETQPKPYTFTDDHGKPMVRYGSFVDGKFQPALDENGQPIQGDKFKPTVFAEKQEAAEKPPIGQRDDIGPSFPNDPFNDKARKPVDERGAIERATGDTSDVAPYFVDPSKRSDAAKVRGTLSQLADGFGMQRPSGPTVRPAGTVGAHGRVVRTGTDKDGRRVAKYEDGFIGPAP